MVFRMLAYTTRGEGSRAVFLLHGFLGSGRNLGLIARRWSARDPSIKLVMPDLTGHGASPPLPPDADLSAIARDVLDLATAIGVADPLELVGHSLGGRVALRAMTLAPERIGSAVLLDSTPARITGGPTEIQKVVAALMSSPERAATREALREPLLARGLSTGLVDWLMMNVVPENGGYRWRLDRAAASGLLERSRDEEMWAAIEQQAPKITLVWGELSSYVAPEDRSRAERSGVKTIRIDGAGHFLHVEKPEAVLAAILSRGDRAQGEG